MIKNFVTFVVDKSGSMGHLVNKVPQVFQDLLDGVQKDALGSKQDTWVRVTQFGSSIDEVSVFYPSEAVLRNMRYSPHEDSTRLWDAVQSAINISLLQPRKAFENIAHLIVVLTDGDDNASRNSINALKELIAHPNVSVAWNVPSHSGRLRVINTLGESAGNINIWETTEQGLEIATEQNMSAYSNFTATRSTGATKSSSLYIVTDASKIKPEDLKLCEKRTAWFVPKKVEKEERIDEFVNRLGGRPYLKGMAFYQLTKPEEIQGQKDILLREKGKKTLYGGPKAKELLGIPQYKTVKVTPGNHANFDIFVQSGSENRKLVRGTTLLVAK